MTRVSSYLMSLGACLILAACNSGPSSSASSSSRPDEASVLAGKVEHIEGLLARRGVAAAVMDDLISALPDRVRLTGLAYDSGEVRVEGKAPSNNTVADYLSRLEGSPSLTNIVLRASAMKIVRGRELQEFALEAVARPGEAASAPSNLPLSARVEELEKALQAPQDSSELLRDLQHLALTAGLQMTKLAPAAEIPGEFAVERPFTIDVSGEPAELSRYLKSMAELPRLWVVDKFSFKAISADDPRSQARASITAKTYLAR